MVFRKENRDVAGPHSEVYETVCDRMVDYYGEVAVARAGHRLPRTPRGALGLRELLKTVCDDDRELREDVLNSVTMPEDVKKFVRERYIATNAEEDGHVVFRKRVPGIELDDDLSDAGSVATRSSSRSQGPVLDDTAKTYSLEMLFSDAPVIDKLGVPTARLQSARRLAVSDPPAAAASLTSFIRANGFPNSRVVTGRYERTTKAAVREIRQMADKIEYGDRYVPSVLDHGTLHLFYDGITPLDQPATIEWDVRGPQRYATEIEAVYQLAMKFGTTMVMALLGVPTIMLGIDIYDHINQEYVTGTVTGFCNMEGVTPVGALKPSELTANQAMRLEEAARKVEPVMVGDKVVGSAIRVTDRYCVLNEHTFTDVGLSQVTATLCGVELAEPRSVANDLCVVRREGSGVHWSLRPPLRGEEVVMVYSVGADVEYTERLTVLDVRNACVYLSESNVVRKGVSGAAIVALSDGALIGVFSAKRGRVVVGSVFGSETLRDVNDMESVVSQDNVEMDVEASTGNQTYERMVRRGFRSYLEQVDEATVPLYTDTPAGESYVGVATVYGGKWYTTFDATAMPVHAPGTATLVFQSCARDCYVSAALPHAKADLPSVRLPVIGERVFLFTKTADEQPAMTGVRTVLHRNPDTGRFVVSDFGDDGDVGMVVGSLIVAESDSAVVGMFLEKQFDDYGRSHVSAVQMNTVSDTTTGEALADVRDEIASQLLLMMEDKDKLNELSTTADVLLGLAGRRYACKEKGRVDSDTSVLNSWVRHHSTLLRLAGWTNAHADEFASWDARDVNRYVLAMWFLLDPVLYASVVMPLLVDVEVAVRAKGDVAANYFGSATTSLVGEHRPPSVSSWSSADVRALHERIRARSLTPVAGRSDLL